MLKRISPSVYWWVEMHGEARGEPYTWNSHLIRIEDQDILVLVDPLPLSADEVREVEELGMPTHILLTCNFHLRESEPFRQKWGCKLLLQQEQLEEAEVAVDGTFQDGDLLWNLIQVVRVTNLRHREEVGFLVKENGGLMIVGDAVCGGRKDMGISEGEIRIAQATQEGPILFGFPEGVQEGRISLHRLLEYPFEKMCFAHGSPVFHHPKEVLKRFIEDEEFWEKLRKRETEESA